MGQLAWILESPDPSAAAREAGFETWETTVDAEAAAGVGQLGVIDQRAGEGLVVTEFAAAARRPDAFPPDLPFLRQVDATLFDVRLAHDRGVRTLNWHSDTLDANQASAHLIAGQLAAGWELCETPPGMQPPMPAGYESRIVAALRKPGRFRNVWQMKVPGSPTPFLSLMEFAGEATKEPEASAG